MKKLRNFRVYLAFSIFSMIICNSHGNWIVETEIVDNFCDAGIYNSIAVDATGKVHIAYYDATYLDIKHAVQDGFGSWFSYAVDFTDDVGSYCSIAVDASGVPHISYHYSYIQVIPIPVPPYFNTVDRGDLKYTSSSGIDWATATVDNNPGQMGRYTSIAVDSNDHPRVAYHDAAQNKLRYVENNGSWGSPVNVEDGGKGASLALDSSGNPHIAHVYGMELRYVYWTGSSWISTMVEDYQVYGERTSIALDSNGYPHIAYVNSEGLHYAYWDGTDWKDELVYWISDTWSVGAKSPSLALDSNDNPFISFHGNLWGDLAVVVAVRAGEDDWSVPIWLLEEAIPGGETSIAIGTNDIIHVSFHDALTGELRYGEVVYDSDNDWLPDWWEMKYFQDLDEIYTGDPDGDVLNNGMEYELGTDPTVDDSGGSSDVDSDGDGLLDDEEINIHGTDPNDPDSDDDGLNDGVEVGYHMFWDSFEEVEFDDAWSTGGNQPWVIDSAPAQVRSPSARSGAISDGQSSYLEMEVVLQGAGRISFWSKTSCENGSDYLRFSTNGIPHSSHSGLNDWSWTNIEEVPAGTNTIRWTYEKDGTGSANDDAVWLDEVYVGVVGIGSSPTNSDSDGDGLLDGVEVNTYGTDPNDADSDDDGLSDSEEVNTYGTNPNLVDTDFDLIPDGWEVTHMLNPTNSTDAVVDIEPDGLSNLEEYQNGTDPRDEDSDNDLMPDGWEVTHTLNPTNSTDAVVDIEPDGLSNLEEYQNGTDPRDEDSDNDLMPDGWEVTHTLNPTNSTDAVVDIEPDGLSNLEEYQNGTNPRNSDTDSDGLSDGDEVNIYGSNPKNPDSDGDTLNDGYEVNTLGTDPAKKDTDDDGLDDNV